MPAPTSTASEQIAWEIDRDINATAAVLLNKEQSINFGLAAIVNFYNWAKREGKSSNTRERKREREYLMNYDCSGAVFIVTAYFANETNDF